MNFPAQFADETRSGITLIELLLVIAIVAILAGSATPFLSRFVLQTHFDSAREKIVSSLRKTQSNAMNEKFGATWGVCKTGNVVRLYSGSCASPTIAENFDIPSTITITGLSDTTFNKRGEPTGALSITVSSSIESKTITVTTAGAVSTN